MRGTLNEFKGRRGFVSVFTAALMSILFCMGVLIADVGTLYLSHTELENMSDAGALAGAQEYMLGRPEQAVIDEVNKYALLLNGKTGDTINPIIIDSNNKKITVTATRKVDIFFTKIFSFFDLDYVTPVPVSATSAARILPATGMKGLLPFGYYLPPEDILTIGQPYNIKVGTDANVGGNFRGLAFEGSGGKDYSYYIQNGYDGVLTVGQKIWTEPGDMVGPTRSGVNYRINLDPNATYENHLSSSPRVVFIPVIDSLATGRAEETILGFAAFFLEGMEGKDVVGKFLRMATAADMVSEGQTDIYELYGTKLVDPKSDI